MYGGNRETTILFIQQYIQRVLKRFPVLSQEETILNLGKRPDELLFDYMTRISNYVVSHYFDNYKETMVPKVSGFEYFASCHTDESKSFKLAKYSHTLPTLPVAATSSSAATMNGDSRDSSVSKNFRESIAERLETIVLKRHYAGCSAKEEDDDDNSSVSTDGDSDGDPEDPFAASADISLVHFECNAEKSMYKGFSKQNNIKICFDTVNLDAERSWRAEKIDRFASKNVYQMTYGISQMVSNGWFLMHRIMMYSGLKLMDASFSKIHDEYTKFKYVNVNVGVMDYKATVLIGKMMEDYSALYPQVFRQPLKEMVGLYKSGKLKTDEFMLELSTEIKNKRDNHRKNEMKKNKSKKRG
jgi:hypothetical protein